MKDWANTLVNDYVNGDGKEQCDCECQLDRDKE